MKPAMGCRYLIPYILMKIACGGSGRPGAGYRQIGCWNRICSDTSLRGRCLPVPVIAASRTKKTSRCQMVFPVCLKKQREVGLLRKNYWWGVGGIPPQSQSLSTYGTGTLLLYESLPLTTKHSIVFPPPLGIMTPDAFFYQIFEFLPRQGPGCTGATKKAWSYLPPLPYREQILDIGCGSGAQTRDLAALSNETITAVDNHQPFLDTLREKSRQDSMDGWIKTVCASMDALPFENRQFDLIWSEGAIFIIGFEKGLKTWKPFVKKGGFMVVSDAAWFEQNPPRELVQWWEKEGALPGTEDQLKEQVRNAGLRLLATFRLPEAGWWENYYVPMLARVAELRKEHSADSAHAAILDSFDHEAEMYRKYKRFYGYTFFVMQNP